MDQFISFLLEAKRQTYAPGGEENERHLPNGSKEFVYQKRTVEIPRSICWI